MISCFRPPQVRLPKLGWRNSRRTPRAKSAICAVRTLRDINIQMSGCCEKLIGLANEKIAAR
jgi:hypothetical protein